MHLQIALGLALLPSTLVPFVFAQNFTTSTKRGLIYIPNAATPQDNTIWTGAGSDLTWYYNYQAAPTYPTTNSMQFVPMMFDASSTTFLSTIKAQIAAGANVSYVLGFNEPDGSTSTGGSSISPAVAAKAWISQMEPLRALGVKLGAPAVTGAQSGFNWLSAFFTACDGGCTADFMTVHWYGDFQGLASNMGQKRSVYPNMTLWITEYALQGDTNLTDVQGYFNESAEFFDRLDYVTHYSYFGSFRSTTSNVGADVAFLNGDGKLTDIGSWYLGGPATGVLPNVAARLIDGGSMVWPWLGLVVALCLGML